ncbi:acetolactate synthase, large subunit, biosynthetic type [Ruminiclostridium papyrosolvens DSM 2782]|uniref:Acetolactate synthase n=1 Tax=Ruminiclostridium papyrosolvens DSM 2782 TaxID=588581 RepID=F1TFC9_9FIRM|nr:biosynthetic-type acetolactate synthase large subunit [Ruminiclostridium papyrosolvens]EGD46853.1 acetolactate synthase, large subunit, biosynthetic type [Ruminiclostridium papyrosolvens DSM 2782]WES34338.1 biosynthetic-type acetolactate synthase large subunit [Ruminiclostridium papyrosolvens DSM 2782]
MKITGAQALVKALELENVTTIFGYPGAAICPFYDALLDSDINHVLTRHEQGAAHAASGYSRVTGKTGVCVATSGPGATNLITGIATAYSDSIPMVAITGQVSLDLIGRDVFQEVDITGATEPFCKHNYLVKNIKDLPRIVKEAFHIASTGRPGPVLIDVPVDIQTDELDFIYPHEVDIKGYKPNYKGHPQQIRRIAEAITSSQRPIICAGGGVISAKASEVMTRLAEKCQIPVVTTLMGIGSIPVEHPLNFGMLGSHGVYAANYAVHNTDLLIIIGARVGDRALGTAGKIAEKAGIIHIDIDPAEIGKNVSTTIPVVGDAGLILEDLYKSIQKCNTLQWLESLQQAVKKNKVELTEKNNYVNPKKLIAELSKRLNDDAIVVTEVGQNQIWAANNFIARTPGSFITSGGLGTMGYGLPAGIGVKTGKPGSTVVVIGGDGSFQMSMPELGTIKQNRLGVKILILNNSRLGMVREMQKNKYKKRYSQVFLDDNPDFVKIAEAYGFKSKRISCNSQIDSALDSFLDDDNAYLLECIVDPEEETV